MLEATSANDSGERDAAIYSNVQSRIDANLASRAYCETLETDILTLAGQINAANYRFLKMLAEFDEHDGWHGSDIKSFAHWLNWKVGMGPVMAREKVRVARALGDLPQIDEAFAKGEVSYSKVRAMTRVATPENEEFLLQIARYGTAGHMERLVRQYAMVQRIEAADLIPEDRYFSCYQDDDGMFVIHARLSPEEGALMVKAIELMMEQRRAEAQSEPAVTPAGSGEAEYNQTEVNVNSRNVSAESPGGKENTAPTRPSRTDALVAIAEHYIESASASQGTDPGHPPRALGEKFQVFVHINANPASQDYTISGSGCVTTDTHHSLPDAIARRVTCDSYLTGVFENNEGRVLGIGRRSRIVPRALRHALRLRDGGCRFPGCTQYHHTEAHHIKHWADGGETDLDNLVTLCRFHHGRLHEGSFRIEPGLHDATAGPDAAPMFIDRFNQEIPATFYPQFPGARDEPLPLDPAINEETAACLWLGEEMDYGMAVGELLRLDAEADLKPG